MTSNNLACKHSPNHILGSMTHNPLDISHDRYSENYFRENLANILQICQIALFLFFFRCSMLLNTQSKCAAVLPFFVL